VLGAFLFFTVAPGVLAQAPLGATVTVEGQLVNATGGGGGEAGVPIMLHSYDRQQMAVVVEDATGPEGAFRFENVETAEGRVFEVMATVGKTIYYSDSTSVSPGQSKLELPVTIYDTTTDASTLRVEQLHTILEFLSPTQMHVLEVYVISNAGDRSVEGGLTLDDGRAATLRFPLPDQATDVSFEGDEGDDRFVLTKGGFASTLGVPPGLESLQFTVGYRLPYQDGMRFERALSYPTRRVNVILPEPGVSLVSEALVRRGARQMPDGRQIELFSAEDLQSGQSFAFQLSGQPQAGRAGDSTAASGGGASAGSSLPVGMVLLGLAFMAGGFAWWRWRSGSAETLSEPLPASASQMGQAETVLIRAIAQLDEGYQAGLIAEGEYTRQRAELRSQLKTLLVQGRNPAIVRKTDD
jgi:hypothetical protein